MSAGNERDDDFLGLNEEGTRGDFIGARLSVWVRPSRLRLRRRRGPKLDIATLLTLLDDDSGVLLLEKVGAMSLISRRCEQSAVCR
jgi:hypothetical protein